MKILVVGGAGYIGSCFVEHIINNTDYEVVILDDLSTGYREAINPKAKFYEGSVLNFNTVDKIFKENKIDGVFHFAAKLVVPESVKEPIKYWLNNVAGVGILLDAMKENGVKNFVFSSTAAVYGFPKAIPVDEDAPKQPCNPYGSSKLACETLIQESSAAYGINFSILRYFNVAGATDSGLYGSRNKQPTLLIPVINKSIILDETMKVFGNDYPTTKDGSCVRDYIHIEDLIKAHLMAFNDIYKNNHSTIFNLGTSEGYTVFEVLNESISATGHKVKYTVAGRREGDPDRLITKNDKILNALGWKPTHDLNSMIKSDYEFRKKLYK